MFYTLIYIKLSIRQRLGHITTITASANGGNSTTVNSHTANGTPATTEKTDIIKMINEVFQSGTNVKSDAISAVNSKAAECTSIAQTE